MQYDELGTISGPSSKQALVDLRRTDARIAEIWRMAQVAGDGVTISSFSPTTE